jgi:hypothetical protein
MFVQEWSMFRQLLVQVRRVVQVSWQWLEEKIKVWSKPNTVSLAVDALADLSRSKGELVVENALLRQQLMVLQRRVKRPKFTAGDRWLLVLLASRLRHWQHALLIIQPDTRLRWHRELFTWLWRRKSHPRLGCKQLADSTVVLIKQMLRENRLWGAERVRGELLKLGIRVSKRKEEMIHKSYSACRRKIF